MTKSGLYSGETKVTEPGGYDTESIGYKVRASRLLREGGASWRGLEGAGGHHLAGTVGI